MKYFLSYNVKHNHLRNTEWFITISLYNTNKYSLQILNKKFYIHSNISEYDEDHSMGIDKSIARQTLNSLDHASYLYTCSTLGNEAIFYGRIRYLNMQDTKTLYFKPLHLCQTSFLQSPLKHQASLL